VPAGHFWMGCNEFTKSCSEDWQAFEVPYHRVFLDTYGIDKTEVTLTDYQACVDDGGCAALPTATGCFQATDHPDLPAACMNWAQAGDYCAWAGKRLCTEAEWEKAARGLDEREYPWGDDPPSCDLAVFDATGSCTQDRWDFCGCGAGRGWNVGSKPAGNSFYGASDMAGNVWEWVSDWRDVDYYNVSPERNPEGPNNGQYKVGRGGGWADPGIYIYSSLRGTLPPAEGGIDVGFRCCKPLPDR
jgi:formylglycine-generating enzyme required for sulfatase activity